MFSLAGLSSAIPVVHLQVIVQASLLPLYNPGFSLIAITAWLWFGFWGFSKILRGKKAPEPALLPADPQGQALGSALDRARGQGSTHQVMEHFPWDSAFGQN